MSGKKIDVLGIGNAIVDVIARHDDAFLDQHGLVKGSMQLVDEAGALSLYDKIGPGIEISGGSAANTIAGITSLGGSAGYIGKVATDQIGDVFAHDIRAAGVAYDTARAGWRSENRALYRYCLARWSAHHVDLPGGQCTARPGRHFRS